MPSPQPSKAAVEAASEWLGGDRQWAEEMLVDVLPTLRAQVLEEVREKLLGDAVKQQMADIFMWAISTGPGHPEATVEKAVEQLLKPVAAALATLTTEDSP